MVEIRTSIAPVGRRRQLGPSCRPRFFITRTPTPRTRVPYSPVVTTGDPSGRSVRSGSCGVTAAAPTRPEDNAGPESV